MVDLVSAILGLWCGAHLAFAVAIAVDTPSGWKALYPHPEDEAGDVFMYISASILLAPLIYFLSQDRGVKW